MKNVLFIVTHKHSGHEYLTRSLNQNERIDLSNPQYSYDHPDVLNHLFSIKHKNPNSASIYGDLILNNKDFTCKSFYKFAKFLFFIRSPEETLSYLIDDKDFVDEKAALYYYTFRLRRIYEMAYEVKNFAFLTFNDLFKNYKNNLKQYLKLNSEINLLKPTELSNIKRINPVILNEANKCYEKYFYKINQLM